MLLKRERERVKTYIILLKQLVPAIIPGGGLSVVDGVTNVMDVISDVEGGGEYEDERGEGEGDDGVDEGVVEEDKRTDDGVISVKNNR